jgi:DNA polymerase IV (DinB-like DNA polymerase)
MPSGRIVVHLDMDAFFAACEIQRRPDLKGTPVVIGADPRSGAGRGVVTTASYEARPFGIGSGMPISQAWRRNPDAVFLPTDHAHYHNVSRSIFDALRARHVVEQVSVDEAYIDATDRTDWSRADDFARSLQQEVAAASGGLTCSLGVAPNKLVAKIASDRRKPAGVTVVPPASVQGFLDPLAVGVVPGIGPKSVEALAAMGVETLSDLRAFSMQDLENAFGAHGVWMHRAARGEHDAPVSDAWEPHKSVSTERTFPEDLADRARIVATLRSMMDELEGELIDEGYWYKTVAVKLRYADFDTLTRQWSLPHHSQNTTEARRVVPRLVDELLSDPRRVRLVGLRFGELAHGLGQADLPSYARRHGTIHWPPDFRPRGQQRLADE